jgi:polyisoprenoid-binding protein YceI
MDGQHSGTGGRREHACLIPRSHGPAAACGLKRDRGESGASMPAVEFEWGRATIWCRTVHRMAERPHGPQKGRFAEFSGAIGFDEQLVERSSVEVTVRTGSIHTGAAERDAHLRSADFFDVERYPTATFRSTRIEPNDQDRFAVHGDLTIKGVTRDVVLDAVFQGSGSVPGGSDVVSLDIQAGRA